MFPPVESQVNLESSNGLFDWLNNLFQPIKKPVRTLSIFTSMAFVKDANGISFKNRLKGTGGNIY
jgi:hypothetical protein